MTCSWLPADLLPDDWEILGTCAWAVGEAAGWEVREAGETPAVHVAGETPAVRVSEFEVGEAGETPAVRVWGETPAVRVWGEMPAVRVWAFKPSNFDTFWNAEELCSVVGMPCVGFEKSLATGRPASWLLVGKLGSTKSVCAAADETKLMTNPAAMVDLMSRRRMQRFEPELLD